jgi:hypothetical protein
MNSWLNEIVCWDSTEYIPRSMAVKRLASALTHFMNDNGYAMYGTRESLSKHLGTLMYNNRGKSCLSSQIISSNDDDHKAHYHHVFSDKWDQFWLRWSQWRDLTDWYGQDRQLDIQEYCWSQLNLDESSQTQVVEELLGDINDWVDELRDDD